MEIIECFKLSKTGDSKDMEDDIIITDNFIAVVDGVTSKQPISEDEKTGGKIACELIKNVLTYISKEASSQQLLDIINQEINSYKEVHDTVASIAAVAAFYSRHYNEVWLVGDCKTSINQSKLLNEKKVDKVLSEVRSLYNELELQCGLSINQLQKNDTGRKYILPLLKKQVILQNNKTSKTYGYPVIDGSSISVDEIKVFKIEVGEHEIVLATDGYPEIFNTLEESEKHLAYVLKEDPLCISIFKSTKGLRVDNVSFDDRAYVRFRVVVE